MCLTDSGAHVLLTLVEWHFPLCCSHKKQNIETICSPSRCGSKQQASFFTGVLAARIWLLFLFFACDPSWDQTIHSISNPLQTPHRHKAFALKSLKAKWKKALTPPFNSTPPSTSKPPLPFLAALDKIYFGQSIQHWQIDKLNNACAYKLQRQNKN